ncbi:carboxypeptidase [Cellulosilyticum sp. I15G10I2]|uniref:carboxypeptidase n=1 Tax=Cellulosilyticum sp. I15G10I2 TaxID=1892843 RepID=UPI00085C09DB|nr:carboxypeptidase [Cellulosilyticum sp. I15G10I2]
MPKGTDSVRVLQVIETRSCRGKGIEEDPYRVVIQYWDFEGNMLAEKDPAKEAGRTA